MITHLVPRKDIATAPEPMMNAGKYHLQYSLLWMLPIGMKIIRTYATAPRSMPAASGQRAEPSFWRMFLRKCHRGRVWFCRAELTG